MIRYFTNYSYGGYEELYLGNSADKEEYRYYLPLLAVKRSRLAENPSNEQLKKEVERLSGYPPILKLDESSQATMPEELFVQISNPGFNTIYRRIGELFAVVISDVLGNDHDEMGGGHRGNPFTMILIGEKEDCPLLDGFVWQMLTKEDETRSFLGELFAYDPIANGIKFSLEMLNNKIKSFADSAISGIDHDVDVPLMILSKGFELSYTIKIQQLEQSTFGSIYDNGGLIKGEEIDVLQAQSQTEHEKDNPTDVQVIIENPGTSDNNNNSSQSENPDYVREDPMVEENNKQENLFAFYFKLPLRNRITIIGALILSFILGAIIF